MLDDVDLKILSLLLVNSRRQWRDIGEEVHLTGQAVGNRIRKMENMGIIEGYTVRIDENLLGRPLLAFITVFMKTANHEAFHRFVDQQRLITRANQISGEGCYLLEVRSASQDELRALLDDILKHGNYRVNLSLGQLKG